MHGCGPLEYCTSRSGPPLPSGFRAAWEGAATRSRESHGSNFDTARGHQVAERRRYE